jgi:predicted DNA-binding transcriptional regulator AlpA
MPTPTSSIPRSQQDAINSLSPGDRRVLNENELAQRWGISSKTLQRWRSEGRGPRYLKLSKRVSYPLESVVDFERRALHESTSSRAMA